MNRIEKKLEEISSTPIDQMLIFRDEQNDNFKIYNPVLKCCSFIELGIKYAKIHGGSITQSVFEDVYARNAEFLNVDFTGTIFKNCNFDKAKFTDCTFKYCKFYNTLLPENEIKLSLPNEPNLRKDLAQNLKTNFQGLGQKNNADIFLDIEIKADQEELYKIFLSDSDYYKTRYDSLDRISSLLKFIFSNFSGFLWGYGHKVRKLMISYVFIILSLSFILKIFNGQFITNEIPKSPITLPLIQTIKVIFSESVGYSTKNVPYDSSAESIILITRFLGIIYLGLLGATLYRKIAR